jgi:hypothetical protein
MIHDAKKIFQDTCYLYSMRDCFKESVALDEAVSFRATNKVVWNQSIILRFSNNFPGHLAAYHFLFCLMNFWNN